MKQEGDEVAIEIDPDRLMVLEERRHAANQRSMEAFHITRDFAERLQRVERGELHQADHNYRMKFGDPDVPVAQKHVDRQREAAYREPLDAALAKAADLRRKLDAARVKQTEVGEAFQRAARLHERCVRYAKQRGVAIPERPDRGEDAAYLPSTIINANA